MKLSCSYINLLNIHIPKINVLKKSDTTIGSLPPNEVDQKLSDAKAQIEKVQLWMERSRQASLWKEDFAYAKTLLWLVEIERSQAKEEVKKEDFLNHLKTLFGVSDAADIPDALKIAAPPAKVSSDELEFCPDKREVVIEKIEAQFKHNSSTPASYNRFKLYLKTVFRALFILSSITIGTLTAVGYLPAALKTAPAIVAWVMTLALGLFWLQKIYEEGSSRELLNFKCDLLKLQYLALDLAKNAFTFRKENRR